MAFKGFAAIVDAIAWGFQVIAELALVALLMLVTHEVFVRYLLDSPTQFSVEYSEYLLVLITFASAAWVLRENRHVRVRLALDLLPPRARAVADALSYLLLMAFCVVLIWQGATVAWTAFEGGDRSSSLVAFPLWIPYGFIPLGALVLALECMARLGEAISAGQASTDA